MTHKPIAFLALGPSWLRYWPASARWGGKEAR
jgi:hypothetical protein